MINILLLQETTNPKSFNAVLHEVLTFIYFIGHQVGLGIMRLIQFIFPKITFPASVIDALGFMAILTLFMILVSVAKKVAWIIVGIGWILLIIRILMIIFKLG